MTQPCPNCGTLNDSSHRFCSNCGTALTPSAPTGEPPVSTSGFRSPEIDATLNPDPFPSYVVKRAEGDPVSPDSQPTMPYTIPVPPSQPYGATQRVQSPQPVPPPPSNYRMYTPGRTGGRDGAAYLPYNAGTAAAVDKPQNQRSWLVPIIIGSAVVLLGLAVLSGYMVVSGMNKNGNVPVSQMPPVTNRNGEEVTPGPTRTPLPANASDEDKIREAIATSNENQITSWKNLDENILKKSYTGPALDDHIKQVEELKTRGMYAVPVNDSLKVLDVTPQGDKAIAHTLEVWTVTYYNKADNRALAKNSYTLNETYHFVKQNGGWYIENLEIQEVNGTPGTGA